MLKRLRKEFKDDVVQVARGGRLTHEEVAHDFNISISLASLVADTLQPATLLRQ